MPIYLDTRGKSSLGIAICARCSRKMSRDDLFSDPNAPGLMCCVEDLDQYDPYRLPPRPPDRLTMDWVRPDVDLTPGPMNVYARALQAVLEVAPNTALEVAETPITALAIADPVTVVKVSQPWSANTAYSLGAQVTESNPVGFIPTPNLFSVFICIIPGRSGVSAPAWNEAEGSLVEDGTVTWMNAGLDLTP